MVLSVCITLPSGVSHQVSTDSSEVEETEKDAVSDVRTDMHSDTEEVEGVTSDRESKGHGARGESPRESVDSPDNIDVVSFYHTPPRPSTQSPKTSCTPPAPDSPSCNGFKVKREDEGSHLGNNSDSGHHGGDHSNSSSCQGDNPATQGLVRHLQLPSDVLYLKEVEMSVHGNPTRSWMICSAIPLPKGSSLGPFSGHMVSSDNVRVGDLIVEFHSKTGHVVLVNVAGQNGAWLALLRPAVNEASRNTLVYLEGGRIWCEVVSDVEIGMELRATFVFDLEELSMTDRELSTAPISPERPGSSASPPLQQAASASVLQQPSPPGHAALIYGCPFCGVRFSSPRTLQGHLSYYCSKKKSEHIVSPRPRSRRSSDSQGSGPAQIDMARIKQEVDVDPGENGPSSLQAAAKAGSITGSKRPSTASDASSGGDSSPPPAKMVRTDPPVFQCQMCSYRADKPASLNRHMRIHNRPAEPDPKQVLARAGSASAVSSGPSSATFCKECNIQFSSLNTYQCHKVHYCSQRNAGRGAAEGKEEKPPFGMAGSSSVALPTDLSASSLQLASLGQNGLLFPPGHGLTGESSALPPGAAMMPGGQAAMILTAPVMTPTGITSMAIPLPTVLVQSIHNAAAAAAAAAATASAPVSPTTPASSQKSSSPKRSDSSPRSVPEEAHQSRSPQKAHTSDADSSSSKELPLDLSTKKSDADNSNVADVHVKREREEERSPVSVTMSAVSSSPAGLGSNGGEDSDRPFGPSTPSVTSTIPTSMPGLPPHLLNPSLLQTFLPMHTMAGLPVTPAGHGFGAVPPGSSKCTDCNIIFYKHENFLIHKQHYCSGKKLRPSASTPILSPRAAETEVKPEVSATVTSTPEPGPSQSPQAGGTPTKDVPSNPSHHLSPGSSTKTPVRNPMVPATGLEDVYYKFFCIPCKIKFSSASNLKAHKEYYCPHGKNSEHTIIAHTPSGEILSTTGGDQQSPTSNGSSPSPGQYSCTQCRATFTSSRLLKLHLCSTDVAQASLLKCSHCDYVTHTDKRLAEHMKVHNPTSAYRCRLCGYRGNTVRGMRMHGKSHTDNGEDFTDSHMIEFQEPPLVPIQTNSDHKAAQGPLNVEAELLRLKNEPYKRRRSRKAYEKVDILVPLDEPHSCPLCGECFSDPRSLAMHLRIHEIASQYMQELARCTHCDYVTKSLEDLRAHMEISHSLTPREEKENRPEVTSPDRRSPLDRRGCERVASVDNRSPVQVKEEPLDVEYDHDHRESRSVGQVAEQAAGQSDSLPEESLREGQAGRELGESSVCHTGDRSAQSPHREEKCDNVDIEQSSDRTDMVRVKLEPELDRDEDSYNDPPLPITFATPPSTVPPPQSNPASPQGHSVADVQANACPDGTSPMSPVPSTVVKPDPDFAMHSQANNSPKFFPRFFAASSSSPCSVESAVASSQNRSGRQERSGTGLPAPYCKNCDISFTYHSTFLAHKKYYCTERAGVPSSATA